jgi:hypothetical protein
MRHQLELAQTPGRRVPEGPGVEPILAGYPQHADLAIQGAGKTGKKAHEPVLGAIPRRERFRERNVSRELTLRLL